METEEVDLIYLEGAFFYVELELVVAKALKDLTEMVIVALGGLRVDDDVVHVDLNKGKVFEDVGHYTLEGCGGVDEAHRHDDPFKKTKRAGKGGLIDVIWVHSDLVEPIAEVETGEDLSTVQLINEYIDTGQGKFVWLSLGIQTPVINYKSEFPILF